MVETSICAILVCEKHAFIAKNIGVVETNQQIQRCLLNINQMGSKCGAGRLFSDKQAAVVVRVQ